MGQIVARTSSPVRAAPANLGPVAALLDGARRGFSVDRLLEASCSALGIRYFALVQHCDPRFPRDDLAIVNYPERWRDHYRRHNLHRIDPVLKACACAVIGFSWSRLGELIELRPEQRAMLKARRRFGLGRGFTVPIHLPGERAASCSFAVEPGAPFAAGTMLTAQLLGLCAFEAARPRALRRPTRCLRLSPRQREVVRHIVAGSPDSSIASEMGLSEETVTKYANAARRRYGVARRTQLVAAALYHGEIGFEELF